MPGLLAPNQVGVREDVSDQLYMVDAKETPFTSMVKKGPAPQDPMLFQYGLQSRGNRKRGGIPDGQDITAFDAQQPRDYIQCRSEVFRRAPMVGFIAQTRSTNGGIAGVPDEFAKAKADQMVELKRDIEKELLSSQDSKPDNGVDGSQTRGIGRYIYDGVGAGLTAVTGTTGGTVALVTDTAGGDTSPTSGYNELAIPQAFRTPATQIFNQAGFVANFSEAYLNLMIQKKWENTGASSELRGFVTSVIKNQIGFFSRYEANANNYTPNVNVTSGRVSGNTLFGPSIDIYKSDWGTFTFHPVAPDFMPNQFHGYFLDMSQVRLRVTENAMTQELPDLGGGPRVLLQSILALEGGDPRSHCKIACAS